MEFLTFDVAEVGDGGCSLEAVASTAAGHHAAVMAEVQQVIDWAWRRSPLAHGPIDDGMEWDHDLQVAVEDGGWHTVVLTMTGTGRFVEELLAVFGDAGD
jgi:hypothetical protein